MNIHPVSSWSNFTVNSLHSLFRLAVWGKDSKSVVNAGRGTITLIIIAVSRMLIIREGRAMTSKTDANLAFASGCPMG